MMVEPHPRGVFTATNELNAVNDFSLANELLTRDINSSSPAEYTLAYDKAGNQTDDGKNYKYVYDAFGRVRQIKNRTTNALISEHTYNALGFRVGWHYDADADADVDADDPWYWFAYDDQWRIVATFRHEDADPKEVFVHHAAGLGGFSGSSYIDGVILRDRDIANAWTSDADSKRTERRYYCQNWRADVSAIVTDEGSMVEWVKYSAYGVAFGLPAGDTDSDGDYDGDDKGRIGTGAYDVRKDVNLDGTEDSDDVDQGNAVTGGNHALGRGVLSAGGVGGAASNRRGYAGYEYAPELEGTGAAGRHLYHVRNRVYDADVGRWTRRDPLGYVDGMGLYEYVKGGVIINRDPLGLARQSCASNNCMNYPPGSELGPGRKGIRIPPTCSIPESTPPLPSTPLPLPTPVLPQCLSQYSTPGVNAALAALRSACPQLQVDIQCGSCGGNPGLTTPKGKCRVDICINIGAHRVSTPDDTLLHEIEHARQACVVYGLCNGIWEDGGDDMWDDSDNQICQEIGGYCSETRNAPYCINGNPILPAASICQQACNSIHGEQSGVPSKKWSKCHRRCLEIAGQCSNGMLMPPSGPIRRAGKQ